MADEKKPGQDFGEPDAMNLEAAFEVPAVFANRFIVTVSPSGARITFAEQQSRDGKVFYRGAVATTHIEAIQLYKLLKKMLAPIEDAIETAEPIEINLNQGNGR